jgi:hypothetical protein
MAEFRLPTIEGRELLIRPVQQAPRAQLQLALVSTYGNIMEAVTLETGDVLGLARGAARVARAAQDLHERERRAAKAIADERYQAALLCNAWLNGRNTHLVGATYLGRDRST